MVKNVVMVVVLSAVTLTAARARADDAPPDPRSRETAFALSIGGTLLSIGLVAAGDKTHNDKLIATGLLSSLVTPSAGEIYAGRLFTAGMGIRLVSAGAVTLGVAEALSCLFADSSCQSDSDTAGVLITVGVLGYASGILYDIATAGSVADDSNRRYQLHVAPTVSHTASSGTSVGLGLSGSF